MILKVKVWTSPTGTGERRVYVEAFRGEYGAKGVAQIHEGCCYVTGNHFQVKGTLDGDLTANEWQDARDLAITAASPASFKRWTNYEHPSRSAILSGKHRPFAVVLPEPPAITRPIVATTVSGSKQDSGSFAIITERGDMDHERDQVLICVASTYARGDEEMDRESGYYTSYAEPTDSEKALPDYQRLATKIDADRASVQRKRQNVEDRRQVDLDAIRAEGREPTVMDELFAGSSDN